uniref:Protein CDV3 homolog n=1 Tax=Ciona savignyi TaxID=51511 RepID=H2YN30_CIOSA
MADDDIIETTQVVEEEDDLDSFFKKKDKKVKKKKKSKKVDTEETGEKLKKETGEKLKKKENEKENELKEIDGNQQEQEEWIDFEDESERDYSDLKIQNLQANDSNETPQSEPPEYNEAGELLPPKTADGPWNIKQQTATETTKVIEAEPVKEEPAKPGVYRPPRARGPASSNPSRRTRKQQAPEIDNEMQFPTLAAAAQDNVTHEGFEVVKTGTKTTPWRPRETHSDIKLGNQFAALNTTH